MTSIPDSPKDQFLFFIDNPLVAAEPGGEALIAAFRALVRFALGWRRGRRLLGHGGAVRFRAVLRVGPGRGRAGR